MWNTSVSLANLSGNGTVQNTKYWGRSQTLTVAAGSFSGSITDNGITSGGFPNGDTRIHLIKSSAGTLTLSGITSHSGDTTVNDGTFVLASTGSLEFTLTPGGHNRVTGLGTAEFHGAFVIDTSSLAAPSTGTGWQLVDMANRFFGPAFSVSGFSPLGDGVHWVKPEGSLNQWVFSESTGTLALEVADYPAWANNAGLAGDPDDDEDFDGLSNREEYAFGLNPKSGASSQPVTLSGSGASMALSYTRRNPALTRLSYSIWYSTDLVNWQEDNGADQSLSATNGDVQTIDVTPSPSLLAEKRLFFQIRAR
jgi:autotransporter-associated beta strand protein